MAAEELADLAALLADRTRVRFLLSLLDGRAWTTGELAAAAGVAPSTASEHLSRLVDGGLLVRRAQGRHRYVQLAGPDQAGLLEHLLAHLGPTGPERPTLRAATADEALRRGRTCYDHLAGRLGVAVADAMTGRGLLTPDLAVTDAGRAWLDDLGFTPPARRPPARACLDWTERRSHLAGAAGAYLCAHFHERGWVRRVGTGRAVRLTPSGRTALAGLLGLGPGLS
ncbi:ArsR/SmtB family transcription factor [Saccharothrix yanglingensis]|uniref:Transcriptional regulator n=1 Tax=Saccharothrix yanglingensis TaxID=659496 RepID=A0ABU0X4C1_9PSEU|nr:winged helix-turn-helix domain-containing protein [Saccharothrix yanglingensis]MDQ2586966.1 transcriptional regulator [Saccharothrix yanglingensis]